MTVGVGDFLPQHCTVTDPEGVVRVTDPRAWLLWLCALSAGVAYRTTPYGFEYWELRGEDPPSYLHFTVKYAPLSITNV